SNPLVASLIAGEATYEWYVASRYGLGFFTVVSDIQDHGRKMDFTDYRLWEGKHVDDDSDNAWDSNGRFGTNNYHTLQSMHRATDSGWQLNKVALGTMGDAVADEGALLLQDPTVSYANLSAMATPETLNKAIGDSGAGSAVCPSIVSPTYPNGISQVTFKAKAGLEVEGNEQYLLVQVARDDGAWTTEGVTIQVDGGQPFTQAIADPNCLIQLKSTLSTISVKMDESTAGAANMGAKFRIVRISSYENVVSEPVSLMVCVRELRVRSATPVATFEAPYVTNADGTTITPASEDEAFMVHFAVRADASRKPCGYAAELRLARRADGDSTRLEPKVTLQEKVESGALSTLYATFEPIGEKYACDSLGNNNLTEDAFYVRQSQVTGLMAGIYDMTLDCDVLGSFEAGRTLIDARERVTHEISVLDPPVDEPERVMRPFILDVREAQTQAEKVELVVQYRTQVMDGTIDYELRETVIEMVPQGLNDKTWTVELPRELTVSREGKFLPSGATTPKDEDAEYVWCEDPTATNGPANAMTEVLNFRLRVTTANNAPNGEPIVRWFGQPEHLTEGQSPTMVNVFPGSTFATSSGIKSDDTTTLFPAPVLVNLAELATSHVTLTFVEGEGVEAEGSLSINGSFAQDFNTWDAISNDLFGDSEFRENVRWAVADFDAEVVPSGDTYRILSGWLPDQGPLADTTELFDAFIAARGYSDMPNVGDYPFYIEPLDTQGSEHHFASWGASHAPASPTLLREDEKSHDFTTENFQFNSIDKVEMVINREVDDMHSTPAAGWMPDLMMRLSEASELSPREGLKGIGTLSFNLSRSEPYNISNIYIFKKTTQATYTGLSSTVSINAHTKAGYSTSLYLINGTTKYEMRVTQVLNMSKSMDEEDKPKDCLVVELWKWDGSTATNLKFNTGLTYLQLNSPATLDRQTLSMWVDENSRLRAQVGTTIVLVSDLSVPTTYANVAVGSAECWPTFSTLAYATGASNNRPSFANYFTGGSDLTSYDLLLPAGMWTLPGAATSILSIQRNPMNADNVAKLSITGTMSDGKQLDPIEIVCKDAYAETPVSLTLGRTDLKLVLTAASGSHVFIDNVRVSSWQGNDDTRTGNDFVPEFTDESWEEGRTNDGFSAVGVWILPEEESQNTVAKENYKGEQCLLMQYSRRNLSSGLNVYEDQSLGVTHTGSTLALYTPFSNEGFGTVSFRYRIPTQSEFNAGAQNPDVRLLLQYARRSGPAIDNLKSPVSNAQWENVSEIIELPCTAGEWKTASITPRLDGNPILADNEGVLRLVMVKPDLQEHDPYIYIDDFRITSNAGEKALWAAGNSLLAESPIHSLYWKDRLEATQTEADFAWYSRLTRGMLFNNDVAADTENGEELPAAYIASPISKNGIGLVKFAARLNTANRLPTTVTLYVTTEETNPTFPDDYEAVETFDVTDTVYRQFSVDLAKHTKVVDAKALRGVCLYVPTMNDTITNHKLKTSRVWMDKLVVSEPVSPTLRLRNVTFSTVPGDDFSMHQLVPEGATDLYDPQDGRNSPLSQPIANAPLVVKVTVDRMQQVKPETVRVFFTYDKAGPDENIKALTSSYSYTDVLGNRFSANATTPIYTWNNAHETGLTENSAEADLKAALDHLAKWSLDVWFAEPKASVAMLLSAPDAATRKGNFAKLEKLEGLDASNEKIFKNTIALTGQETYDSTDTLLTFVSTEDVGCVKDLAPNSMVRYAVWAIFETEDSTAENPRYGYTVLDASSYTDHPWYFPRNFNAEMRDRYNVVVDYLADYLNYPKASSNFFSPYF
ncbi:MAG: hypothetical protein Q4C03_02380, partial [bacterium]|nr:hypothetical protein [bacterium]